MKTITTMLSIQNRTPSSSVTYLTYHVIEGLHFISYVVHLIDLDILWDIFMGYCLQKLYHYPLSIYTHNILLFRLIEYKIWSHFS